MEKDAEKDLEFAISQYRRGGRRSAEAFDSRAGNNLRGDSTVDSIETAFSTTKFSRL